MTEGEPAPSEPGETERRAALSSWIYLLVPALVLVLLVVWWAMGLRTPANNDGFGSRLVTFDFQDTHLSDALAVISPQAVCEFEDDDVDAFVITLKVVDMREDQAIYWIAQLVDQRIILRDGVITVCGPSWLERSYQATAAWSHRVLGFSFWPNR